MNLTSYFLWTAGSVLIGGGVFWIAGKSVSDGRKAVTLFLSILLGLLGARAFYVLARLGFFLEIGGANWLWPTDPMWSDWGVGLGFALWGAIGGAAMAAVLCGRGSPSRRGQLLDALALGGSLALGLYRFGEFLIGEGRGDYVEVEGLCFFPVAVMNEWEEWNFAVFVWEGLAALIIFVVLLAGLRRRAPGRTAQLFMILFCSSQALLESLRRDSFLRWMFVRVSQVTAAVVMALMMVAAILAFRRDEEMWRRRKREIILCCALYLLCVGGCVALEFAMDKSAYLPLTLCYGLEALCCIGLGVSAYRVIMPPKGQQAASTEEIP